MIRVGIATVALWMAHKLIDLAEWVHPAPINEANLEALDAYVKQCAEYDAQVWGDPSHWPDRRP